MLTFTLPRDSVEKREFLATLPVNVYRDFEPLRTPPLRRRSSSCESHFAAYDPALNGRIATRSKAAFDSSIRFAQKISRAGGARGDLPRFARLSRQKNFPRIPTSRLSPFILPADPIADLKAEFTRVGCYALMDAAAKNSDRHGSPHRFLSRLSSRNESGADAWRAMRAGSQAAAEAPNRRSRSRASQSLHPHPTPIRRPNSARPTCTQCAASRSIRASRSSRSIRISPRSLRKIFSRRRRRRILSSSSFPLPSAERPRISNFPGPSILKPISRVTTSIAAKTQGHPGTRLNPELLLTPAFRDMNAVPGRDLFLHRHRGRSLWK